MTDPSGLCGMTLEEALRRLRGEGLSPVVTFTRSPRRPASGTARVVQAADGGARLTAAYFPDRTQTDGESA